MIWFVISIILLLFSAAVTGVALSRDVKGAGIGLIPGLVGLLLLIPAAPIMLLTAIVVRLESPGPVIYKQDRVGLFEKEFTVYKFRSMRADAEKNGAVWASAHDARVTKFGKFIRKVRIDELS